MIIDDDISGDIELLMLDVLENVKIEVNDYNEDEFFLNNGIVNWIIFVMLDVWILCLWNFY